MAIAKLDGIESDLQNPHPSRAENALPPEITSTKTMPTSTTLVVGFGSMGKRHSRLLSEISKVGVVSSRTIDFPTTYSSLEQGLNDLNPDYVVVANNSSDHGNTIRQLSRLGFSKRVLVEKPIVSDSDLGSFAHNFEKLFVGYNLRFHPLILKLRDALLGETICSVHSYVGQYLPLWRPERDYRLSYSANPCLGGGVLLDLSHDLDYLLWILGGWISATGRGGKYSELDILSEDAFTLLLDTPKCPVVAVHLNYLDRITHREIIVNTSKNSIKVDLIGGTMQINDSIEQVITDRDETYRNMHIDALANEPSICCKENEGVNVVELIRKLRVAAAKQIWIENE
ncbi:MAG: Gfo/Idh/MocA family oxidoreductase [Alphaproteobacteria bacterium]|nr:Gfo/Idh/MocA family oxidoreductase [Alphaproteobacteria bacterium]